MIQEDVISFIILCIITIIVCYSLINNAVSVRSKHSAYSSGIKTALFLMLGKFGFLQILLFA
jgi:hypothetical protein